MTETEGSAGSANGRAVIAEAAELTKIYTMGGSEVRALDNASISIRDQDFVALMGPSGSGKSTLLHILAGIDRPSSGRVTVLDQDVSGMSETQLAKWRNQYIGFVFQTFNLIPVLTAAENVELPLLLTGLSRGERRKQVETALELVGLADRMGHTPRQMSGGQQQRVAIARAIATDPDLILADEPTGNLDSASAEEVLRMFRVLNEQLHKTVVIVTHDPHAAHAAKEVRYLEKGQLLPPGQKPSDW
ncbi:MAG: ABC transporter ATP-binding protein [Candidatus Sumerlaeaceae bacterium]|nr:ABC transporter ATP-binding protein [Candidatus Sumerlaeaceae bacterium]